MLQTNVECPRCKRILHAHAGEGEVDCNCHLYCPDGTLPKDCSVVQLNNTVQYAYPSGIHNNAQSDILRDPAHQTYYCSTHNRYYYKVPISVPVDWTRTRLPKRLRLQMEF